LLVALPLRTALRLEVSAQVPESICHTGA
jgi:hypothetical protein